jgi:4-amino-4-deoxy-L-arabinose transferase-like glycosyltransferase
MPAGIPLGGLASGQRRVRLAERAVPDSARLTLALWALVLGAMLVGLVTVYDPSFIDIDGAFYMNAAKNLASGHGFATTILWNEEHYHRGQMPAAQTVFPPGYPLLIALVSRLGVDPRYAAFLVSLVAFVAIPLVVSGILRTSGHTRLGSFAVGAAWLGSTFAWFNVLRCMSEMPFILLTLLSLLCVIQSERHPGRGDLWLAAAGAVAGLAFTVRYQGVFYILSLGCFFLLRLIRQRDWPSARALILVAGSASAFVLPFFIRNHVLTGKMTGTMISGERSLLELLQTLQWGLGGLFGFTKSGLHGGSVPEVLLVLVVVAGLAGGVCWIGRLGIDRSALWTALAKTHISLSLVYMAVSVILLIERARQFASGHIDARYLMALVPFGLLCLPDGVQLIRFTPSRAWHARAARVWLGAVVIVLVVGQVNVIQRNWERLLTHANPYRAIRDALERPLAGEPLIRFLQARVTEAGPLLGNEAQLLGAVLDRPVLGLATASYTRKVWTEDQVRRLVSAYGVAYVAFFPDLFDPADPEDRNSPFFHDLKRGSAPPWLGVILIAPEVQLYRVEAVMRARS